MKIARKKVFRGFNGIRTRDLCVSAAVLSQLSYEDPYTGGWPIYWVHQPVKGMKHWMKWCELREYKWKEYVTIAVNRNLSNCENCSLQYMGLHSSAGRALGEHCSANAEATGSNPVEAPKNFFSGYFRNCLNYDSLRWSHTPFICIPAVHIISFSVIKYARESGISVKN